MGQWTPKGLSPRFYFNQMYNTEEVNEVLELKCLNILVGGDGLREGVYSSGVSRKRTQISNKEGFTS